VFSASYQAAFLRGQIKFLLMQAIIAGMPVVNKNARNSIVEPGELCKYSS
jgi:hypothetical protein